MTAWLIRRFVKDYENTENGEVRAAYGTLGSCVGILVNLLLSAGKFLIGLLSGSVAILADAANNLSDAAGSIVALVSTRVARKPVDAEHPFGHGRMEYLGSLGVGLLILVMAFTLLKEGMEAILTPAALSVSWPVLTVLGVSIAVKAWLYFFYRRLGRATDNGTPAGRLQGQPERRAGYRRGADLHRAVRPVRLAHRWLYRSGGGADRAQGGL